MYLLCVVTLSLLAFSGVCNAQSSVSGSTTALSTASSAETTQIIVTTTEPVVPTTVPKPTGVSYVVTGIDGSVCILLNSTIKFSLPYKVGNGFSVTDFYLPSGGSTSGSSCNVTVANSTGQLLKVTNFYDDWIFHLFFERNGNSFAATKLMLKYKVTPGSLFPNASGAAYYVNAKYDGAFQKPLFASASIPGYLICNAESTTQLKSDLQNATNTQVTFKELTVFAFGTQNSTTLQGTMTKCSGDAPPPDYLVPIIVGCALAGIILIVLIAYIIGRYRSRSTYQTV